ncbi:MBL fold metallo-hydrolase [Cellulomonas fimi]|uniref:MBL fold metallo-hydrolase n=1 Tax=Cellulomonas fimi TaxID=1708 RepID=A0A7Y0M2W5_CELFI|nr:MBL fold metallo-hydrolase [Cellulomonas fimi]NMR21502.1 MBL fold metallo-hydrolase [Cellulomonas fimi]
MTGHESHARATSAAPGATGRRTAPRPLSEVAAGVWTATAQIWTSLTTVVLADDGACLVVDPGITPGELAGLAAALEARSWVPAAGFATHPHWDHVLWTAALGDAARWATTDAVERAAERRDDAVRKADGTAPGHDHALTGLLTSLPDGAVEVPWAGPRAVVVPHTAHCPGHAALVLPASRVLLAGDMLSDLEIPLLDLEAADPVADYRRGLDTLEAAARAHGVEVVVPGHGHVGDETELARRFAADRAYLDALEADRAPDDDRLATPWLVEEHHRHVARVRGTS